MGPSERRQLVRLLAELEAAHAGIRGPADDLTCSLRRTCLSGHGLDEALPRGRAHRPA
jgi:hypothetical protein